VNQSRADAPLDPSPPHDPAAERRAHADGPNRLAAARAIWPGSPTPALTYPDPPRTGEEPSVAE
jgi:hypothetical protein